LARSSVRKVFERFFDSLQEFCARGSEGEGLDPTEYVEHLEREFEIVITPQAVEVLQTLGDLCQLVATQRAAQERPLGDDRIWQEVRRITSEEFGVDPSELHRGIRYVEDLNC
jgi:hypothetical protein